MSLFVLASKDGWVDIMYDGLDAVGVDQQVSLTLKQNVFTWQKNIILHAHKNVMIFSCSCLEI